MFEVGSVLRKRNSGKACVTKEGTEAVAVPTAFLNVLESLAVSSRMSFVGLSEDVSAAQREDLDLPWSRSR